MAIKNHPANDLAIRGIIAKMNEVIDVVNESELGLMPILVVKIPTKVPAVDVVQIRENFKKTFGDDYKVIVVNSSEVKSPSFELLKTKEVSTGELKELVKLCELQIKK